MPVQDYELGAEIWKIPPVTQRDYKMSAGMLKEPKVITDFKQRTVCLLPAGFYFDDERWDKIWQRFDEKGDTLSMADLEELFPGEETVQHSANDNGKTFNHRTPSNNPSDR